jgi:hypothetical protein
MIGKGWLMILVICLGGGAGGEAVWAAPGGGTGTPNPAALDTDSHLVGWWKLDEPTGKVAADASGRGHAARLEGSLSFEANSAPGRIGRALRFGGKEDCARTEGFRGIAGTAPRTVAAWIKTPAGEGELISWGENEHGRMWIFGHVRGRIGVTPKGGYLYMKQGTSDDAWHHVAVVVQEASPPNLHDHVRLYRDGVPAEIDDIGLLDLWPIETGQVIEVRIGAHFKGLIDDLRLYDRPLTEDEVGALYRRGTSDR